MAHSLTNAKAARFMDRVSEFSTRGSRRGFVDLGIPIPDDQLNPEYYTLKEMEAALPVLEKNLQIPENMSIKQYRRCIRGAAADYPIRHMHYEKYAALKKQINRMRRGRKT